MIRATAEYSYVRNEQTSYWLEVSETPSLLSLILMPVNKEFKIE